MGNTNHAHCPTLAPREPGSATTELMAKARDWWIEAATQAGIDLTGFRPHAPLDERLAWAAAAALDVGVPYVRFSSKKQGSTEDQARADVQFGARNGIYCPPELLCVDEAYSGRKDRRPGRERAERILREGLATVLLVFRLSRLYRRAYKAVRFINEEVVEAGCRAISVMQGVDTAQGRSWRMQVAMYGTMDEDLIEAIGDHVRESLVGLLHKGWVTGAIPVGYMRKEVLGARPTRRGHPRMGPAVDPVAAELIRQHYIWIDGGMELEEGWRRWRAAGGPVDPRSTTRQMSAPAYRRMLSRKEYTGRWPFCRKRNTWSDKQDTLRQKPSPEAEQVFCCEELRIVDDELYTRVQLRLAGLATGPRPRRPAAQRRLWDVVVHLFRCAACDRRLHIAGCHGRYMRCPNPDCPARAFVERKGATVAVCAALSTLAREDNDGLADLIVAASVGIGLADDGGDRALEVAAKERYIKQQANRIADLEVLLGSGDDEDRRRRQDQILKAQRERGQAQADLERLRPARRRRSGGALTRPQVLAGLEDLAGLLDQAASGALGSDLLGKAADVFAALVGGSVRVTAVPRPGRHRALARGSFTPRLLSAAADALEVDGVAGGADPAAVDVWLRKPPRVDMIADEVRQMYDVDGKGFRVINRELEAKYAEKIGSGNCCAAYRRWYQQHDLPLPPRRTAAGRPRKAG